MAIKEKKVEQKSKLMEILRKDYRWENYLFFTIALVVLLLGVLILNNTLIINEDAFLIGPIADIFAWLMVAFGGLALIYAVYPFFKPAFPEIKRITWLKGKKYFANVMRVFIFIIVLALLLLLFQAFITEILAIIWG